MRKIFCLCVSAALFAAVVVSCHPEGKDPIPVSEVRLSKPSLTLEIYDFTTLVATVLPANADDKTITWKSSDESVVKVENGKLTAVDTGIVTITVTTKDGGKTATCTVTVTPLKPGEGEMIFVEGGTFMMGDSSDKDARPVHKVKLSSFKIAKYEVNQDQWRAVMGGNNNPANNKGGDLPIEQILFSEVLDFIGKLNTQTGKKYRLPTEAEWEYAARGGNQSKGYTYSGSNTLDEVGWYLSNSGNATQIVGSTTKSNELGIYDMSGNVSEYCSDKYGLYSAKDQKDPQETVGNGLQVIRGGNYMKPYGECRVSSRTYYDPYLGTGRAIYIGFRLVLDVE